VAAVAAAVRRQWLEGGSEKTKREGLGGLGSDDGSCKGASAPLRRKRKKLGGGGDGGGGDGGGGGDDGRAVAALGTLCYVAAALYPLAPPAPTVVLKGGWIGAASVRELRLGAPAGGSGFTGCNRIFRSRQKC
jgi:hypothetical protein